MPAAECKCRRLNKHKKAAPFEEGTEKVLTFQILR